MKELRKYSKNNVAVFFKPQIFAVCGAWSVEPFPKLFAKEITWFLIEWRMSRKLKKSRQKCLALLARPSRRGNRLTAVSSPYSILMRMLQTTVPSSTIFAIWKRINLVNNIQLSYFYYRFIISVFCLTVKSTLPSPDGTLSSRFNGLGNRLLCFEKNDVCLQLTVYDFPTRHRSFATGKVVLMDPADFSYEAVGWDACCFAGLEDDLVISGSTDKRLFVWSLPDGNRGMDCTVTRSLRVLDGLHAGIIRSVRCSSDKTAIVSGADEGVIKLWTSR